MLNTFSTYPNTLRNPLKSISVHSMNNFVSFIGLHADIIKNSIFVFHKNKAKLRLLFICQTILYEIGSYLEKMNFIVPYYIIDL